MAITIQRLPRAGGASTTKTLAEWGLAMGSMDSAAWAVGQLQLVARGASPAFDNPVFEYLDTLKVFEGSTCIWWGPVISTGSTVQPAEQRTYVVADPMWWAQWVEFKVPTYPEPEDIGLVRGYAWLAWALNRVAAAHPVTYTTDDTAAFTVPVPDLRGSANCLEVIQRVARLHPLSSQWWDLSGATPLLRCALRTGLAPVSLARSRCQEPITLTPLHNKQLTAVWLEYVFTNSSGTRSAADDRAGTAPYTGPNTLHAAMKVGTNSALDGAANYNAAYEAQGYHIAQMLHDTWAALPWSGTLVVVGTPSNPLPTIRPGQLLNLTGGRTEWASMDAQVQRVGRTLGDVCERLTIELGCGDHLGPTDLLSLARAGVISGGAAGDNPSPYDPPTPPGSNLGDPGTYHDLNGGTGGSSPNGTIAVEARGGSWTKVGFAAFVGEPSKRWLTKTAAGTITYTGRNEGMCNACESTHTVGGSAHYDPSTGLCTSSITYDLAPVTGGCATPGSSGTHSCGWDPRSGIWNNFLLKSATATLSRTYGDGSMLDVCGWITGENTATLSDEDTTEAAIGRMLAASPAWTAGMTGIRTIPVSGITGVYRELRYRTQHTEGTGEAAVTYPTLTGLAPWWRYRVTVHLERRPVDELGSPTGDVSWSAAGERVHYLLADIDGEGGIDWQTVEPPAGYELRVGDTDVEVAP